MSAKVAWDALAQSGDATLIDVRSKAEWVYVGVPVFRLIGKSTILVEWDDFTSGRVVPDFVGRLDAELSTSTASGRTRRSIFICRSGNRSRKAAIAATAAGYRALLQSSNSVSRDVLGPNRHRGTAGSWKAEGLPWVQS